MNYGNQWSGTLSDFRFSQWSGSNMFYGSPSYESGNRLYGSVNVPNSQNTGWYDLEVWDYNTASWVMLNNAYYIYPGGSIDSISPNSGDQGEQLLNVTISGSNVNFGDQWSGTLSDFRFSQWSGTNIFYGNSTSSSNNYLYGNVYIPINQSSGWYDLEVYNNNTNNWLVLNNAFYVNDLGLGCTDSIASNYDPSALLDDGSCMISLCDSSNYSGPAVVNFTKPNYADWNNFSFRDVITSNCHLTRQDNGGLYNYLTQYQWNDNSSSSGVLYAQGDINSNGPYLGSYPFNYQIIIIILILFIIIITIQQCKMLLVR